MEPIIIKNGKKNYAFYSDKIVVSKKDKIIHERKYSEIEKITYNPELSFKDHVIAILNRGGDSTCSYFRAGLAIFFDMKIEKRYPYVITIRMSRDDFDKIKDIFGTPIEIV